MITIASGISGTFGCDPKIPLALHDHNLLFAHRIFSAPSFRSGSIAWTLDFEKRKKKERTDRSLRKELVVIYSMVVLELAFATMGSPILTFIFLMETSVSLANGRFVAFLCRVWLSFHIRNRNYVNHDRFSVEFPSNSRNRRVQICGYLNLRLESTAKISRTALKLSPPLS